MPRRRNPTPELAREAAGLINEAVTAIRNRGHTREHALHLAALELGIGLRRVRSLLYGGPVAVDGAELARIRASLVRFFEAEATDLSARSAALRKRSRDILRGGS